MVRFLLMDLVPELMKNIFSIILLFFFFSTFTFSQDISGNIEGRIIDNSGKPLSRVNVSVQGSSLQGMLGTTTNEKGFFRILSLSSGVYKLKLSSLGFSKLNIENIRVHIGKTISLGVIKLNQEVVDLPEITVSGEKPVIDPFSTSYGGNLESADYENLPVDRNYRNITTLLPQANASYFGDEANIGGATGFENKYFVDGVEVTDPLAGRDGTNLPYNFIQEIEVKTGGYSADSRSSLGGLLNVITYSGSNEFHGSVFGFYTSNQFSENKKLGLLDVQQGDFSNYDVGFGIGGPIIQDELWFYAAYNPTFNRRDVEVPSYGTYVDKTLMHSFAVKLNWRATDKFNLVLTTTGDPTKRDAVGRDVGIPPSSLSNMDSYFQNIFEGGINFSLNGKYTFNEYISIEGLIARIVRHDTGEPSSAQGREIFFIDDLNNSWSGGVNSTWDSFRHSTTGRISSTFLLGDHIINSGLEYKINSVNNIYDYHNIERYDSVFYGESIGKGFGEVYNQIPSVFILDNWRIFNNLNLNLSLRWDGQYITGSDGEIAQKISLPVQPRIGFIFLPVNDGTQRIFGSFGRYSQEFALFQSVNYHSSNGYDYFILFDHDPRVDISGGDTLYKFQHVIRPEVEGLRGQYFDEFNLGYEILIGWKIRAGVQGVYRILREAIDDAWMDSEQRYQFGNPGKGILSQWPRPQRDYTALIFTIERRLDERFNFMLSYVLSRDYGNYEGLFSAFGHGQFPNANGSFDDLNTSRQNATGLVPNDRTHVFKFSGYYSFPFGLTAGVSFIAQSGTPLSELALTEYGIKFLSPRGSLGRTPALWDLNTRFTYILPQFSSLGTKLILDFFHIASQRKPVDIVQLKYYGLNNEGNPVGPNPFYGQAFRYQPSLSMRLGLEVNF